MSTSYRQADPEARCSAETRQGPAAVARLISTIENTGGIVGHEDGTFGPVGDPDWIDLADAYLAACKEEGRRPMVRAESLSELLGDRHA